MNTFAEALPTNSSRPNAAGPVEETVPDSKSELGRRYRGVRRFTEKLCETLEPEDYVIQTMPEASPTKWHLARTSWFFEPFALKQFFPMIMNPTEHHECLPNEAYAWTGGKAVYADGVPFPPVHLDAKNYLPSQANNLYIYPAVCLAERGNRKCSAQNLDQYPAPCN